MIQSEIKLTKEHARKIRDLVKLGLCSGSGDGKPGNMCVEQVVSCVVFDRPKNDRPKCVGSVVSAFKRRLNDSAWSSNDARAKGMRAIAIAQLGSNTLDQKIFVQLLALETIRVIVPEAFKAVASIYKMKKNFENQKIFLDHAEKLSKTKDLETGKALCLDAKKDAAAYAAAAYGAAYAADAADAAAAAAAYGAAYAAYAAYAADAADAYAADYAADAADAAADAADAAAAYAAYAAAYAADDARKLARDKILTLTADICLKVLKKMKSPGCKWLSVLEEN